MTNLLILAAGKGTRTALLTYNNAVPKCLMSVGDKTVLEAIIDSYDGLIDNVFIACLDEHKDCINDILSFRGYKNYELIAFPQKDYAIVSLETAVKMIDELGKFDDNDWYVNWSDVFVKKMSKLSPTTIITDKQIRHRNYAFHSTKDLIKIESTALLEGNVAGIFFASAKDIKMTLHVNRMTGGAATFDFDVALRLAQSRIAPIWLVQRDDIIDVGDFAKYAAYMRKQKSEHTCRYFNDLQVERKVVKKRPKTEQGIKLHKIELAYYREFSDGSIAMPRLLGYDVDTMTMTLERVKGQTCQSFIDSKSEKSRLTVVNNLINKFNKAIASIHAVQVHKLLDDMNAINAAITDEFYTKIDGRVKPCMHLIDKVMHDNELRSIDGMPLCGYDDLQIAVNAWLQEKFSQDYFKIGITHGDPNTDNTLYTQDGIMFVDPRGYFGNLKTLGLGVKQYDLAKFAYGFSGYSKFNSAEYIAIKCDNHDAKVYVGSKELQGITDVSIFDMDVPEDIKVMVGIIWVKLTSYIINDPMKSVAAYLYGNAILTKLLDIKHI